MHAGGPCLQGSQRQRQSKWKRTKGRHDSSDGCRHGMSHFLIRGSYLIASPVSWGTLNRHVRHWVSNQRTSLAMGSGIVTTRLSERNMSGSGDGEMQNHRLYVKHITWAEMIAEVISLAVILVGRTKCFSCTWHNMYWYESSFLCHSTVQCF